MLVHACAALMATVLRLTMLAVLLVGQAPLARAHEGHDHGEQSAPAGEGSPRVSAVSERYQFVGIVEGEVLVVYLDRADDNAPVTSAALEITLNGTAFKATPERNGTYEVTAPLLRQGGQIEILVGITEGQESDLLVGAVRIPRSSGGTATVEGRWWGLPSAPVLGLAGVLLVGAGLLALARRRKLGVVAFALVLAASPPGDALAHEGHDHGHDTRASTGNTPSRRPDGALFVPKPTQRLLEVRTKKINPETASKSTRLAGRVIPNPNFSGVVQPTIQGRYQAPSTGVPALGTRVRAGDLLGVVAPAFASIDTSDMAQTLGDLEQKIAIAKSKLGRQEQLLRNNIVARATVEETRLELDGLVERRTKLLEARARPEELRAPVDGVIAAVRVVSGQVVSQSDKLFEIIDPSRMLVEALVFERLDVGEGGEATALLGTEEAAKLRFLGRSRALQQQYALMQFEIVDQRLPMDAGTAVIVLVRTGAPAEGLFVPRAALAQAPNGQSVVFEHVEPEVFMPRPVRTEAFDSDTVRVVNGLEAGSKIVVRNAPLLNQVR